MAQGPEQLPSSFAAIADGARAAGRSFAGGQKGRPYTTLLTTGCVLRPGESATAERAIRRLGPVAVVALHAVWETAHGGAGIGIADDDLARAYGDYIDALAARRGSPADRRYLDVHEGHMVVLKPGEERFVDEGFLGMTITGPIESVRERVRALRDAGVDNLALQAVGNDGRELIEEFGREVIGKL